MNRRWMRSIVIAILIVYIRPRSFINQTDTSSSEQIEKSGAIGVYSQPKLSNDNAAICLVVKNETLYLDEWTEFHIALGFTSIFIYDTTPNEPDQSLLDWYARRKDLQPYVKVAHDERHPAQQFVYTRCLREDASNNTFVAFFDIDEFLVLKKHDNVIDMLNDHCTDNCGQLSINWNVIGTSGETKYTPIPITKRNKHSEPEVSPTVKVIVRPEYVNETQIKWVHTVDLVKGAEWYDTSHTIRKWDHYGSWDKKYERISNHNKPSDVALLYHYKFKSAEELHYKKCIRGRVNVGGKTDQCRNKNYDVGSNADKFDDLAWQQLTRMLPKYQQFDVER